MWGYESLGDYETLQAAMEADPRWDKFISAIWELGAIQEQNIKMLRPASFSPIQ